MRWTSPSSVAVFLSCLVVVLPAAMVGAPEAAAQVCMPAAGGPVCESGSGVASLGDPDGTDLTVGNPIHPLTGSKVQDEVDGAPLPGLLGLEIRRHYQSAYVADDSPWGRGWRLSYDTRLYRTGDQLQIVQADGRRLLFRAAGIAGGAIGAIGGGTSAGAGLLACEALHGGQGQLFMAADGYRWVWPNGRWLRFDRDGALVQVGTTGAADPETVRIQRDGDGRIRDVVDPAGRRMSIDYDKAGRLARIRHPLGTWHYRVTEDGRLLSVAAPDGVRRQYAHDDAANPSRITAIRVIDRDGVATPVGRWAYDDDGRVVAHIRPDGSRLQMAYQVDQQGLRTATLTDALGRRTVYRAADVGGRWRPIEIAGPGCQGCGPTQLRFRHDSRGLLVARWRIGGNGVAYRRDAQGRVIEVRRLLAPDRAGWTAGVDGRHGTDESGRAAGAAGSAVPLPSASVDPWIARFVYADSHGMLPSVIERPSVIGGGALHRQAVERDEHGRPVLAVETGFAPAPGAARPPASTGEARPSLLRVASLSAGPPVRAIERRLAWTYRESDGRHLPASIDGPLPNGPLASPQDSDVIRIDSDPDSGLPVRVRLPGGTTLQVTGRDAGGRVVELVTDDGYRRVTEQLVLDLHGRWTERRLTAFRLDASARIVPGSTITRRERRRFDPQGRLVEQVDAAGRLVRHRYDAAGRSVETGDVRGYRLVHDRDAEGRVTRVGLHLPGRDDPVRARYLTHDADDRLQSVLEPDGRLSQLLWTSGQAGIGRIDGRAMQLTLASALTGSPVTIAVGVDGEHQASAAPRIEYDDFGRRVMEHLPDHGLRSLTHDAAGRILTATDGEGVMLRFEHDAAGRLRRTRDASGRLLATYHHEGRWLVRVDDTWQTQRLDRDALGHVVQQVTRFTDLPDRRYVIGTAFDP